MYQNVTDGLFMFLTKKFSRSSEFYYVDPGLYPSITENAEAMNTLIQEKHKHSENCITVEVSQRTQKVEIYLAFEISGLVFLIRTCDTFSEVLLVMSLEYRWEEKDLTNQNLLTTFSAYTLSWCTRTWLSAISLATRKLHCCVSFLFFRSSRLETL